MESDGVSTAAGSDPPRGEDRLTMIVGSWPRDARRGQIVDKLKQVIEDLGLRDDLDRDPFVAEARRSFALVPFVPRAQEHRDDCRARMHRTINKIMQERVKVPAQDRLLWAAVTKGPAAGGRAQHCSLVRSLVRFFDPAKVIGMRIWARSRASQAQLSDAMAECSDRTRAFGGTPPRMESRGSTSRLRPSNSRRIRTRLSLFFCGRIATITDKTKSPAAQPPGT